MKFRDAQFWASGPRRSTNIFRTQKSVLDICLDPLKEVLGKAFFLDVWVMCLFGIYKSIRIILCLIWFLGHWNTLFRLFAPWYRASWRPSYPEYPRSLRVWVFEFRKSKRGLILVTIRDWWIGSLSKKTLTTPIQGPASTVAGAVLVFLHTLASLQRAT